MTRPLKVFICHASEDKAEVRVLYQKLVTQGVDAWFDEEKLLPGQDWQLEIPGALESSDVVLICLSTSSMAKEGYVQKEIKLALDKAKEKPEGAIFIIPVRLQECGIPKQLRQWQWVDLFEGVGYDRLIQSLMEKARGLGLKLPLTGMASVAPNLQTWANMSFVYIPAGRFMMGSKEDNPNTSDAEKPQHKIELSYDFYIGRYPVTKAQYDQFVLATGHHDIEPDERQKRPDHPAANITWYAARDFCRWLNQTIASKLPQNLRFRLPTEAEWEKAARGTWGNEWPWGNEWDANLCNSMESGNDTITRVGYYSPGGDSPFGTADMAGNVWEWTISLWGLEQRTPAYPYPYKPSNRRENINASSGVLRVLRGGSFKDSRQWVRCAARRGGFPLIGWPGSGFRVVICPTNISRSF